MIPAPLLDYLTFLDIRYVVAAAVALACLFVLIEMFSKEEERSSIQFVVLEAGLVVIGFVGLGFIWFVLYRSYAGVSYAFWPLSCSIFIAFYASITPLMVSQHRKDGVREIVEWLVVAAFAILLFSPIAVLWIRMFENFHPLWP